METIQSGLLNLKIKHILQSGPGHGFLSLSILFQSDKAFSKPKNTLLTRGVCTAKKPSKALSV